MSRSALCLCLGVLLLVAGDNPLAGDKFLEKADEKFSQSMQRALDSYAKAAGEAYETRLRTYRTILAAATKAGDFKRASAVQERIDELEQQLAEVGTPGKKKAAKIPKDAVKLNGHHYVLVQEPATWHAAEKRCEDAGGHLVTIESDQEFVVIRKFITTNWAWIGATDEDREGEWRWVTGESIPANTVKGFRLDNQNGIQHCLSIGSIGNLDDECGETRAIYICEWDS